MSYQEQYNAGMNKYKSMLEKYEETVSSPRYCEILGTMPFEFLNAKHLCENLELYAQLETKPRMIFRSVDEATVFYRNLISFKSRSNKLMEDASFIAELGNMGREINDYVADNIYLPSSLSVVLNEELIQIAEDCLAYIPQYPQMLTKAFRYNYIESAIASLDVDDLEMLTKMKVIKPEDIDHIALTDSSEGYDEKIKFLCEVLNHPLPIVASYDIKLKGVTFPNVDGSSRQENLKELQAYVEAHPEEIISLQAESYTYYPEIGDPEPAIKVSWNGKCIGNVAKDVAADVEEKFSHPQCTATLNKLSGGRDGMSFGCMIKLNIVAPGYAEKAVEKEEKQPELSKQPGRENEAETVQER